MFILFILLLWIGIELNLNGWFFALLLAWVNWRFFWWLAS